MRRRTDATTITGTLSDETRQQFESLDAEIQALLGMLAELIDVHTNLIEAVKVETLEAVVEAGAPDGITVFEVEEDTPRGKHSPPEVKLGGGTGPKPPESMQQTRFDSIVSDDERRRTTPFTRAPRSVQVAWISKVMAGGEWFAPVRIAREYATDERHYRYMRHAVAGRLREMWEEGLVERRDSLVRGSLFEFRLKQG